MRNRKLIFRVRPLEWFFRKSWYSIFRWKNPVSFEGNTYKMVDIGAITIGIVERGEHNEKR